MLKNFWNKESQSLLEASRKSLRESQERVEELNNENKAVHTENKEVRGENEFLRDCLRDIEKELVAQQYGNIENLKNKIKSILETAKSY